MSELPPGFVLDQPAVDLPPGFVLDNPSIAADIAKSAGIGMVKGGIGLAGLGGDAGSLLGSGVDKAGSYLGAAPDKVQQFKDLMKAGLRTNPVTSVAANLLQGPSSQDIQSKVEGVTGPLYKPQTIAGEYAQTAGEFLPGLIGGPEALGAKLLTRVAAPAVASETAGQLTKGTAAEPYARVGAALLGGAGASKLMQPSASASIPSAEDLLKSGSNKFEAVKASDAVIKPSSVEQMAKDIKTEMLNAGKHPTSEGQAGVFAALDRLEAMGASPGGVLPKDMEIIRKNLVDLKPNLAAGPTARMATDKFMEKYAGLGQADLLHGSNPFPTLKDAIGDWAAGKRSETIQGKRNLAELNANSPVGMLDSGAGGQALQRTMKQLARPMNNTNIPVARKLGFNNQEVSAINEAASGTKMTHAAELLDRLIPAKLGAIPAAVARQIGGLTTKRQVSSLDSLVRSRSPLAAQVAAQLPPQITQQLDPKTQALLTALIAADPILGKQASQPVGQSNTY